MKNVLVTGGLGFIGSNFIQLLIKNAIKNNEHVKIVNLDKLTYAGNLSNLKNVDNYTHYSFIKGDICNFELLNELFKKNQFDIIVNFAAESHVDRSINSPIEFLNSNIIGTFYLLEACKKYGIKLFFQISTDEVYGSIKSGYATEEYQLMPSSPYSASKVGSERLAYSYFKTYEIPIIISRSTNNYGQYQATEKLIPLFITNLLLDKKVPLYGDGLNRRDWINVLDHCEAILFLIKNGQIGETYNIAGNSEKTNLEITEIILKELNKNNSLIQYTKDRLGHDRRYAVDDTKIKKLGFKNKYSFEIGIKETIKWYRDNFVWWKK